MKTTDRFGTVKAAYTAFFAARLLTGCSTLHIPDHVAAASEQQRYYSLPQNKPAFEAYIRKVGKTSVSIDSEKLAKAIDFAKGFIKRVTREVPTPPIIAHEMLVNGDFELGGRRASQIIMEDGAFFYEPGDGGILIQEPHPFQFLSMFARTGIPLDTEFKLQTRIGGQVKIVTLQQILDSQVSEVDSIVKKPLDLGWFLITIGNYYQIDLGEHPGIKDRIDDAFYASFLQGIEMHKGIDGGMEVIGEARLPGEPRYGSCYNTHLTEGLIVATASFEGAEAYQPLIRKLMRKHLEHMTQVLYAEENGLQPEEYLRVLSHVIEVYAYAAKYGFELTEEERNVVRYAVNKVVELVTNSDAYLDGIEEAYQKMRVLSYLSHGLHGIVLLRQAGVLCE